jgi:hypothetical protein
LFHGWVGIFPTYNLCYNKVVEELMNQVKELLHESVEDQALTDEEMLEEHAYEESFQEDPDEYYQVEDQHENTMSYDPFEDLDNNLFHDPGSEEASDAVDHHIDTFIQIGKCGWDLSLFTFDEDLIYDIEGIPQTKNWSMCIYDSDVWDGDGDIITNLFHPFEDNLMQRFQDNFQPSCSNFDRHQVVACPKQSKVHSTKRKYFHVETLGKDLQTKKRRFLSLTEEFFSKVVPYPISPFLGNRRVFFGSLILSHPSGSNDLLSEDEDEPSSIPLQRWINQACGYACKQELQDDRDYGFSFQQDFLPPTHLHEFYFMTDYMSFYAHDFYVLDLSLLFHMIKHKGKYLRSMIRWLLWLYHFT